MKLTEAYTMNLGFQVQTEDSVITLLDSSASELENLGCFLVPLLKMDEKSCVVLPRYLLCGFAMNTLKQ